MTGGCPIATTRSKAHARLRILYVSDTGDQLGGAERSLLSLVEHLDPARYELHAVLAEDGRFAALLRGAHVQVARLPLGTIARTRNPLKLLLYGIYFLHGVVRLACLIRRRGIQILHVNKNTLAIHAIPAARLAGAACVWHVRNPVRNFGRVGAWLVRRCGHLLCVSESIAAPFREAFPDAAARITIVPEGIDPAPYATGKMPVPPGTETKGGTGFQPVSSDALHRELGVAPGECLVGTVGRITPWKGQDDFLRAAALVAPTRPDARFLVVGDCVSSPAEAAADRAFRDRLHTLAANLGLGDRVVFTGFRDDVPAVMNALDLFVLPSHGEPFGIVLLEAMAASRPIVATAAGGVPDIVRDAQEALLVPPRDPAALAAAIERLLGDRSLAAALGHAAQARVNADFPLWRPAALVREIYHRLAGHEGGPPVFP
ncbi:MAG TPA: glycosyltransferase family 4 protein [Planctomycetota bacterium]|nr:glycosyltransferase family 4 protein [Planctomycetota bacterium]